jgi:hypothetical protein
MEWLNDICPITRETLAEKPRDEVFVHDRIGMDLDALYMYLCVAVYFRNPVSRVPFHLSQVTELEAAFERRHGPGSIRRTNDRGGDANGAPPTDPGDGNGNGNAPPVRATDPLVWLSNDVVLPRVTVDVVRQQGTSLKCIVDLQVPEYDDMIPSPPRPRSPVEEKHDAVAADGVVDNPPQVEFPVRSILELFMDAGREGRLRDEIHLSEYLSHESTDVLHHILWIADDARFQQHVWNQTSSMVLGSARDRLSPADAASPGFSEVRVGRDESVLSLLPADVLVEAEYTENWETYRVLLLHTLETRYVEVTRELATVSSEEWSTNLAMHWSIVHEEQRRLGASGGVDHTGHAQAMLHDC